MGQRREAISVQPAWWAWRRAWGHSEQSRSWTRHLPLFRFIHSLMSPAVGAHPVCGTIGELDARPGFRKLDVPWSREGPQGGPRSGGRCWGGRLSSDWIHPGDFLEEAAPKEAM